MKSPKARRRRSSCISSNYPDDQSLAASTIKTYDHHYATHKSATQEKGSDSSSEDAAANDENDHEDDIAATNNQDNTNYSPPQEAVISEIDASDESSTCDVSVATRRRHNMEHGDAKSLSTHDTTLAPAEGGGEVANDVVCDMAEMEVPTSPSIVTLGTIATSPSMAEAEADAHSADVSVEMPPCLQHQNEALELNDDEEAQLPTKVEGLVGDDGQALVTTAHSIAGSKATRTTKASEASRSSRSRVTTSTRKTSPAALASTTSTVKSFGSLAGRGGRKALRAAKLANMRPDMVMPSSSMPVVMSSSLAYKAAGDDMTLKTVDGGNTVRTSFTRRSTRSVVTTATARSFYSLSARSGRKAVMAAKLASKSDIASPLDLPPDPNSGERSTKKVIGDEATVSKFDDYFPMEGGGDYDEEEGNPRGSLVVCSDDNFFNADVGHEDNIIDTEDILDEGAWDNYEWHELPNHVRDAACLLGCTSSKAWNCGGVAYSNDKSWNELSSAQIRAARVLGFNQRLWDHDAIKGTRFHEAIRGLDTYRAVVECNKETGMIASIALPATWENLIELFAGAIQVALISQYLGPEALAAYAVVEGCLSIAYNIGSGLADAEEILVCQALGMEDTFLAGQYTLLSIATYVLAAAPVYITLIFFIDEIIIGLRLGDEIATIAMLYIPVLALSHLIHDTFANTLSSLLRCSGKNLQIAVVDSIFQVIHVALVAMAVVSLDFGLAGVAWIEVVSALIYGVFIFSFSAAKGWLQPFWGGLTDLRVLFSLKSIKNMMALTIPLAWNEFLDSAEWSVVSLLAGWIGENELNAWTILGSVWGIFEYAPEGIHSAVVMRLAFHLGRGDPRSAKISGYKCLACTGTLALLVSVVFFAWHNEVIALFTYDALIATILEKNALLISVGNVIVSLGATASAVLTAQGRPGIATWIYFFGSWCMSIPLCAWFTFDLGYNTSGLVCAMLIGYTTSSLGLLFCVFTANWAKASMEAIAAEAEEDGSFDGDDSSTIAPYSVSRGGYYEDEVSIAKSPSLRSHHSSTFASTTSMLERKEGNSHRVMESPKPQYQLGPEQGTDATHVCSFAASPLDRIVECDNEDDLSACGMETTISPSGNFTIVENREQRFRQWVGDRPSNAKKSKRRPPRAPKKGSRRTDESNSLKNEK